MALVSVVTPLYNCSNFLDRTICSVLEQTFQDWELILVDDCSTDKSLAIALHHQERDERIRVFQLQENSGAAVARNLAIRQAKGQFIAFLDSDDRWLSNKLEVQLRFMQEKNIEFSFSAYEKLGESGGVVGTVGVPAVVSYRSVLKVCSIGCLTAMYDVSKLGKIYMPLIRKRQDLGLWLRILREVPYAYGIQDVLAQYQLRSDSISANKISAARYTWQLYREVEGLNFISASYYFLNYAVNGLLRTRFPELARRLGVLK